MLKIALAIATTLGAAGTAAPGRVELHCHLDGSVSVGTLLRIAQRRALTLPGLSGVPTSEEDIWTALRSMGEHWRWFDLVNEIIGGDEATLVEIAEDFVAMQAARGVRYTEVRWDPVRPAVSHLANASISQEAAVRAVERGLRSGAERHDVEVHQLLCAMRGSPGHACYELARLADATRSGALGGVVGMDIAGDEYHWNNSANHVMECFRYAKLELQLNTTVHAGESYTDLHSSWADVRSAVEVMLADRVGHGYAATQDEGTLEMLLRRDVHVEACPAGGRGTGINLAATGVYRARGVNFGMSTDDPAAYFANVSLAQVEALVRARLNFSDDDVAAAYRRAHAASFARDAARIAALRRGRGATRGDAVLGAGGGSPVLVSLSVLAGVGSLAFMGWVVLSKTEVKAPAEVTATRTLGISETAVRPVM